MPSESLERLSAVLRNYGRIALAFSGGVDSSLLLAVSLQVLGPDNVRILFAHSCLLKPAEIQRALNWPAQHNVAPGVRVEPVDFSPLGWKEFVRNPPDRCYHCKRKIYAAFIKRLRSCSCPVLVDGTNRDDLASDRPGLRAIQELGVRMPLVEAGLHRHDVCLLSRQLELSTWQQPSSSCLATRIPHPMRITPERLQQIAAWEESLEDLGFNGCRVRFSPVQEKCVLVQIREADFSLLVSSRIRRHILHSLQPHGIDQIFLDLHGREPPFRPKIGRICPAPGQEYGKKRLKISPPMGG